MNVLVTGASGFVGRHLLPALQKLEYNVTAVDSNGFTGIWYLEEKFDYIMISISDIIKEIDEGKIGKLTKNIDIISESNNQLVFYIEKLLFLTAKVSTLPLITDFTKIYQDIGISKDDSERVQEINKSVVDHKC